MVSSSNNMWTTGVIARQKYSPNVMVEKIGSGLRFVLVLQIPSWDATIYGVRQAPPAEMQVTTEKSFSFRDIR
jgi:hypothetical protein